MRGATVEQGNIDAQFVFKVFKLLVFRTPGFLRLV